MQKARRKTLRAKRKTLEALLDVSRGDLSLQQALLEWYRGNKRDLPWRGETDPYKILLSEVLLQQTRVDQVIPYYHRFLRNFPTLEDLAKAEPEAVLKAWEGCGYYARARNLHKLAQTLTGQRTHGCASLPATYTELLKLPGLGSYTAAAVASIAFRQPIAAVDGNVRRVISRWLAWGTPSAKEVQAKADEVLATQSPGDWNQAMMELGATICTPKAPSCWRCPVAELCQGKASPQRYPAPKLRKQKAIAVVALVLISPNGVYLEERKGRILGGLWGFPMEEEHTIQPLWERLLGTTRASSLAQPEYVGMVSHAFTHRKLTVHVYRAVWDGSGHNPNEKPLSQLDRKILTLAADAKAVQERLFG